MPIRIDVWSDYVCPWCFLVSISLERLQQSHNVTVVPRSFELRPKGAPPIAPDYLDYIENVGRPRFEAAAREQYGIQVNAGPFGIDSRPALRGAKYAEAQGKGPAYHKAMFEAYWLEARNIEASDVLRTVAGALGLNAAEFFAALEAPETDMAVNLDIRRAQQYGISSVPSLILAEKYLVEGAQPYETLVQVVEQIEQAAV